MKIPFLKSLPNLLTLLRLILIPVFVFFMIEPDIFSLRISLGIFIIAALTDFIDGKIARKYCAVSDTGKLLDPIADKILVMSALVMLLAQGRDIDGNILVPSWCAVMILARETWVNGLRSIAASLGIIVAAGWAGKLKTAMQMFAICLLLLQGISINVFDREISVALLGAWLLILSIVVSYWGAVEYTLLVFSKLRGKRCKPLENDRN